MNQPELTPGAEDELLSCFVEEAREHLQAFSDGLLQIETGAGGPDVINAVFRAVHTLKGCARTLGCVDIGRLSHTGENVLDAIRNGKLAPSETIVETLFTCCDMLLTLVEDVEQGLGQGRHEDRINPLLDRLTAQLADGPSVPTIAVPPPPAAEPGTYPDAGKDLSPELVSAFVSESADNLELLGSGLLALERAPHDPECINRVFRAVHNIKGSADYVGLAQIKTLAHHLESVLDQARGGRLELGKELFDLVLAAGDTLRNMVAAIQPTGETHFDLRELTDRLRAAAGRKAAGSGSSPGRPIAANRGLLVFVQAAAQHVESIQVQQGRLAAGNDAPAVVATIRRSVQTLLGAAGYMGRDEFQAPCRQIIEILELHAEGRLEFDDLMLGLVGESAEELEQLLEKVREEADAPPAERLGDAMVSRGVASREDVEAAAQDPMRIGDRLVATGAATREEVEAAAAHPEAGGAAATAKSMRVDQRKLDEYITLAGELVIARNGLLHALRQIGQQDQQSRQLKEAIESVHRITTSIQDNAMAMRMIPVRSVFQRFPRIVRDISRTQDKQIDIQIFGEETEIDKQVAEAIQDPLVHLVRNAADHGIESPQLRREAGKRENGLITLSASREGNFIVIDVIDDGAGINAERLKVKAVEKGLLTAEEAEGMPREKALELIFAPGLSTASVVSDISGRGVGMDVVRSNITAVGGSVSVSSEEGEGSRIRVQLPLTLAVTTVVLVECRGELFALPMESVRETVKAPRSRIRRMNGRMAICLRDEVIGVASLGRLLDRGEDEVAASDNLDEISVVIVSAGSASLGLIVDELVNQQEIVVKPLPAALARLPGLGGATVMGDGSIVLVLDALKLLGLAVHGRDADLNKEPALCLR